MKIDISKIKHITQEGIKREAEIQAAKKEEELRLKLEAENEKRRKKKFQASVKQKITQLKKEMVLEAIAGKTHIEIYLDKEHTEELENHFSKLNFSYKVFNQINYGDTYKKIDNQSDADRINEIKSLCEAEIYEINAISSDKIKHIKNSATIHIKIIEKLAIDFELRALVNVLFQLDETDKDGNNIHDTECIYAMELINKQVRNLRNSCLLINSRFDGGLNSEFIIRQTISWKDQSWMYGLMDDLLNPYALNWISSGTGQGYFNNLKTCIESTAKHGRSNIKIYFECLGINKIRWGLNEAFKTLNNHEPLGVLPFTIDLLESIFNYLGFKSTKGVESDKRYFIMLEW